MIPPQIEAWYSEKIRFYRALGERVEDVLASYSREQGFVFEDRLKSPESLAEKVESGRFQGWNELDDVYACTIAAPLASDERMVCDFVAEAFLLVEARRKGGTSKAPDTFRFDSTRLICKLRPPPGMEADGDVLFDLPFEVQVKSLFELAWAKTTHALTYKSDLIDWRRYRLAAHLKATAEQLDILLAGFEQTAEFVPASEWPAVEDKARIRDAFKRFENAGSIPSEVLPKDWSQFSENVYRALQAFAGRRPSGFGSRRVESLDEALRIVEERLMSTPPAEFPRSLSLFQYTVAILATEDGFNGHRQDYFLPITDELVELFPDATFPAQRFEVGGS